jgi:hypothetical protein
MCGDPCIETHPLNRGTGSIMDGFVAVAFTGRGPRHTLYFFAPGSIWLKIPSREEPMVRGSEMLYDISTGTFWKKVPVEKLVGPYRQQQAEI